MKEQIKVKYVDVDLPIDAEYNPQVRTEEELNEIENSIKRFGIVKPFVLNSNPERKNVPVGGHGRRQVAKRMGIKKVPVVYHHLTLEEERELNIRLNHNGGSADEELLAKFFQKDELLDWGMGEDELSFFDEEKKIDKAKEGDTIEIPQSVQLKPPMEYILILADPNSVEWEELKEILKLKMVRRGGYKKGSAFDAVALERVLNWSDFKERLNVSSDSK